MSGHILNAMHACQAQAEAYETDASRLMREGNRDAAMEAIRMSNNYLDSADHWRRMYAEMPAEGMVIQ